MQHADFAHLPFREAFPLWLESRSRIKPSTRSDYEKNFQRLVEFFGEVPLVEIHVGHLSEYRRQRLAGEIGRGAKASRINHEINMLQQMLQRAGLWAKLADWYEPLPQPKSPGIALSREEEQHLFRVAAGNPRWLVAYCCALISRNTCAGPGEIQHLRLANVDLENCSWIRIEECVKNKFRIRTLECNDDAQWALAQLVKRAKERGSCSPEDYLLPHRSAADRPMHSWKRAWYSLRAKAGEKYPRLARARFYDLRHTAGTTMLQDASVSYNVIEHYMGHRVGSEVKRRYDHIRDEALKAGARALASGHVERRKAEEILEPVLPKPPGAIHTPLGLIVQKTVKK